MKLWIKSPRRGSIAVDVVPTDTITQIEAKSEVKNLIGSSGPGCEAHFVFRGSKLSNNTKIADIQPPLKDNDYLILLLHNPSAVSVPKAPVRAAPAPAIPGPAPAIPSNVQDLIAQITEAFTNSVSSSSPSPNRATPQAATSTPTPAPVAAPAPIPKIPSATSAPSVSFPEEALQTLMSMGFSENRCKKALILNNMNPSLATDWLIDHVDDPMADEPLSPEQIARFAQRSQAVGAVDPIVTTAEEANICTFYFTGQRHIAQKYQRCFTCNMGENEGCCVVCAKTCHNGHSLSPVIYSPSFYCDCGSGLSCIANPTPGSGMS